MGNRKIATVITILLCCAFLVEGLLSVHRSRNNCEAAYAKRNHGALFSSSLVQMRASPPSSLSDSSTPRSRKSPEDIQKKKNKTARNEARYIAATSLLESTSKKQNNEFCLRRLESDPSFLRLEPRDRRFARRLVSTVERRMGQIDKILSHCSKDYRIKPTRQSEALIQAALRLGAAQLLFLDTPQHAAVKETVDILRMHPQMDKQL